MNIKKKIARTLRTLCTLATLLLLASSVNAQVPVALSPVPAQQFLSQTGVPLASGCVYTYITNTSTPLATYVDGTGVTQNTNPVTLDAGGFGNLWLSNSSYRFTIYSKGLGGVQGNDCFSGTFQRTVDNVSAYTIINQAQNIFLSGSSSDPSGTAGELAYRTDIPCFRGFTTFWDCFVRLTDPQTLTNKTLTAPTIANPTVTTGTFSTPTVNNIQIVNTPGTYIALANSATGTSLGALAKLIGAPSTAQVPAITDTGGVIGICVLNCTTSGIATIQQSGTVNCIFDGPTTANDYVQITSIGPAGFCHDAGSGYPLTGQVVGRVLVTNGGLSGITVSMNLFGPEVKSSASVVTTINKQDTQGVATAGNGGNQVVYTYTMPGGTLGTGKCLIITFYFQKVSGVNNLTPGMTFGATSLSGATFAHSNNQFDEMTSKVCNNIGTTTAQWAGFHAIAVTGGATGVFVNATAPAENTSGNITITGIANVAAPDTWKGMGFTVITDP